MRLGTLIAPGNSSLRLKHIARRSRDNHIGISYRAVLYIGNIFVIDIHCTLFCKHKIGCRDEQATHTIRYVGVLLCHSVTTDVVACRLPDSLLWSLITAAAHRVYIHLENEIAQKIIVDIGTGLTVMIYEIKFVVSLVATLETSPQKHARRHSSPSVASLIYV